MLEQLFDLSMIYIYIYIYIWCFFSSIDHVDDVLNLYVGVDVYIVR